MPPLFTATIILLALFSVGWMLAVKISNFSIVDAIWALSLPLPVILYLTLLDGNLVRDGILLTMALAWSFRLGLHLSQRIYAQHPAEDSRYAKLREHWSQNTNRNFYVLFLLNAALVFLLSLPFYFGSQNTAPLALIEFIGITIFAIGYLGEMIADRQLKRFLTTHPNNEVCQAGLWNYSRHPNYFFEAVIWLGIYLFACGSPAGLYTIHAPLVMIWLLTKVTGIPPAEKSSLKSKGDAYRRYQQSTSAFVPWFKKKSL